MPQRPAPRRTAWLAVVRCLLVSIAMLLRREIRWPRGNVGRVIGFADGTSARVYRETVAARVPSEPCFLAVSFRLRGVHGVGHTLFRIESILNTPLFVGFPGFVSKLWLANDRRGTYRGLYEWDGADLAEHYARSLWRVQELVSEPASIDFQVFPGLRRDEVLADPRVLRTPAAGQDAEWCRVVAAR